ncbi:sigma-54-dependent Fis family transcriptional regulator [Sphingomonas sinipercae]|uniref:DNA-binding transcriptional regulator NtrC n=1 Tax=Sphingomonas sinipercae TaxID=2714944 RepID=A0A6G7ZN85_9SPHN|nr:sigma-54 dependent transcriptional regulator [Sphingomonas sinipercae]QIL02457.1 sigma-54-dependent Fis family transcriptional regulator [Sphingomonas sinipercae]
MPESQIRSLLLVDANPAERRLISAMASRAGWTVIGADGIQTAVAILRGPYGLEIKVALLGDWQADKAGEIIDNLRACRPELPVVVLTESGAVPKAIDALRAGATDFLGRPIAPERLLDALATAADRRRPSGELMPVAEKLAPLLSLEELIGSTPEFRSALAIAAKAARNRLPILIIGEAGSGKETFARAIHAASLRARGPLVTVDCKATPHNSTDSELFGHQAGAFAGAFTDRQGKIVEASGGTLVLDAIDELPGETQEALDRVLATGEVRPVGCNGSNSVDVRLIATAGAPLGEGFNPALRERVSATVVTLPPLRERSADIPSLARHLLSRFAEQQLIRPLTIDNEALSILMHYGWPGNVRQLASALLRAALECEGGSLGAADFPHIATQARFSNRAGDAQPNLGQRRTEASVNGDPSITLFGNDGHLRMLEEIEADIIRLAIGHYGGRMTEVARRLGIGRSTLYRKLGDIGIDTAA